MLLDRRSLLVTGALGLGAGAVPGFSRTPNVTMLTGFTHSVGSGEPGPDSMLLWTRYVPAGAGAARVVAQVSDTEDFARVVSEGEAITGPWRDHSVKITAAGLAPATPYFYRFVAPDGSVSPAGRTRTLPDGDVGRFGIAVFSCSNMAFGYFNAYAHAAARDDIDLWAHLGDYFYEFDRHRYVPDYGAVDGRWPAPRGECIHLADYRLRYASYRADPDLQALHAAKPMIFQPDDHEVANDDWEGGAENHQPGEGDWGARKAAAMQAMREWLPVSETPWGSYDIGTLATLFRTENRVTGRTRQPDIAPLFGGADPVAALKAFRDGAWQDPAATMLGSEQEAWLDRAMAASVRSGRKWQVAAFGTIMGQVHAPSGAMAWVKPHATRRARHYFATGVMGSSVGLPLTYDNWGGYPAARARFLRSAQALGANLVVICGDSHNAWAFDLAQDGRPAGVEFAGHSVTAPGLERATAPDPRVVAEAMLAANPELRWCDTSRRGYMALTLTPARVSNDGVFVDTVLRRSPGARIGHSAAVERGRGVMG